MLLFSKICANCISTNYRLCDRNKAIYRFYVLRSCGPYSQSRNGHISSNTMLKINDLSSPVESVFVSVTIYALAVKSTHKLFDFLQEGFAKGVYYL